MIKMCKVLELYPPNYYKWEHQEKKREERRFSELGYVKQIERIFNENRRNIGYYFYNKTISKRCYSTVNRLRVAWKGTLNSYCIRFVGEASI